MPLDPDPAVRLVVPDVARSVPMLPSAVRAGRHWTQASVERAIEIALASDSPLDPATCRLICLALASEPEDRGPLTWFGVSGMISPTGIRMHLQSASVDLEAIPWVSAVLQFLDSVPERDTPHVYVTLGPLAGGWVDLAHPETRLVEDLRSLVRRSLAASGEWRCVAATGFGPLSPLQIEAALFQCDPVGRRDRLPSLRSTSWLPLPSLWDLHLLAQRIMQHGDAFIALVSRRAWPTEEAFERSYIGAFASPRDFHLWSAQRDGWLDPLVELIERHHLEEVVEIDWEAYQDRVGAVVVLGERSWHAFRSPPD